MPLSYACLQSRGKQYHKNTVCSLVLVLNRLRVTDLQAGPNGIID